MLKSTEKYLFDRNDSQRTKSVAKIAGGLGSVQPKANDW
jgi:hypothetical protein